MTGNWYCLLGAWLMACIATASALFIGEVMLMTPCVLCWYQRICMFPLVLILGQSCYSDDRRGAVYTLPLALGGGILAVYHTLLVGGAVDASWLPCSAGVSCANQKLEILNGVPVPWLSLLAFGAISTMLITYLKRTSK